MSAAPRSTRLKRLELQGYKTFATRTAFDFAPTITAIVGPNGSGKSNIADSIRWVLGEQAYSLLRGKKTEDMIFAGSESRPRASMASVVITFDNSDGWLPIEFSEVSVGRRAYRDGQNEYLLNGQRVRLRDVVELLAQSGLAQRTYTIIGQGLVDAALSLRADERRALFEEAAGIGLYRTRREEALRRLDATEHNLERVQDILAELRPRLKALERQARRAQEYEEVRSELQAALLQWYGHHWHRSQTLVAHARREAVAMIASRDELRGRQAQAMEQLARRRAEITRTRAQLHGWIEQSGGLNAEREELGRKVAVDGERLRWLEDQTTSIAEELASLEAAWDEAKARLERARAEAEPEEEALRSAEARTDAAGTERGVRAGPPDDPLQAAVAREATWKARLEAAHLAHDAAARRLEALQAELAIRSEELREAERAWEGSQDRLEGAQAASRQAADDLEVIRVKLGKARAAADRAESERARLVERQAVQQARLDVLAARERTLERYIEAGQSGKLAGLIGRWSNAWRVAAGHQVAIMAALGDFADGLTFHTPSDIDRALQELRPADASTSAAFLPAATSTSPPRLTPPADSECLGIAADLVSAPAEMKPVVELLLGRTLVAASAAAARRLLAGLPLDARVVTLQGELFFPGGPVLVSRREGGRAQQRELTGEVEKVRRDLEIRETEARRLATEVETLSGQMRQAEEQGSRAREAEAAASLATHEKALRREASRQTVDLLKRQAADEEQGVAQAEADRRRLEEQGRSIAEERARAEAARSESDRQRAARQLAESSAGLELLRRSVAEARQQIAERAERTAAMEKEIGARRARLESNRTQQSETKSLIEAAETRLREVESVLEGLRGQSRPAETALAEAEAERERLEAEEDRGRLELQSAESEAARIQIELARREEEATALRRRIEDDFGLVALTQEEGAPTPEPLPLEGLVQTLPVVEDLPMEIETQVQRLRSQIRRMGAVNPEADREYQEVKERVEFLTTQTGDLRQAEAGLRQVVAELDELMQTEFRRTFDAVAAEFSQAFTRLFQGGTARLTLVNAEDLSEAGIEIEARLPGRREQGLAMLSGGERSLTACALIFALLKVSPTPFCVLDEVDAMLDDANVARFREMLTELSGETQFLVITHNKETVQAAQTVYGVSMGPDTASQVISLRLDEAVRTLAA